MVGGAKLGGSPMAQKGTNRYNQLAKSISSNPKKPQKSSSTKKVTNPDKPRAYWNPMLEKSLVDLLHEHNNTHYRGNNGWSSEGWNRIVKEFNGRNTYVYFTKSQVQEKEKDLKKDYKLLKEARMQSGVGWNESRSMIDAEDELWDNLVISFPKIGRFKTKSFPLFDALGELYDGHIAEGTYNVNSTQPPKHPELTQVDGDELSNTEPTFPSFEETWAYNVEEDENQRVHITLVDEEESVARTRQRINMTTTGDEEESVARTGQRINRRAVVDADETVARTEQRINRRAAVDEDETVARNKRAAATTTRNMEEKEPKRPKKQSSNDIASSMDRFIEMREKQFAIESAQLANEKKVVQGGEYTIKRCISEMLSMELSNDEKAAALNVFKDPDDKEIFLSSKEDNPQVALVWLRKAVAKLPQGV